MDWFSKEGQITHKQISEKVLHLKEMSSEASLDNFPTTHSELGRKNSNGEGYSSCIHIQCTGTFWHVLEAPAALDRRMFNTVPCEVKRQSSLHGAVMQQDRDMPS